MTTPKNHSHQCATCGHVWVCMRDPKPKPYAKCEVTKSASVNKGGPYCHVCRHLREAVRGAKMRDLNPGLFMTMVSNEWQRKDT